MAPVTPVAPATPVVEQEIEPGVPAAVRASEFVYLVFAVIDILLVFRVFLKVLGANPSAGFTQFIYGLTNALLAPFHNVLPVIASGTAVFETSALLAILVYALMGYVLAWLISVVFLRDASPSSRTRRAGGFFRPRFY
jgi:uncharacterized protein YggT (Ycf19 family)